MGVGAAVRCGFEECRDGWFWDSVVRISVFKHLGSVGGEGGIIRVLCGKEGSSDAVGGTSGAAVGPG